MNAEFGIAAPNLAIDIILNALDANDEFEDDTLKITN